MKSSNIQTINLNAGSWANGIYQLPTIQDHTIFYVKFSIINPNTFVVYLDNWKIEEKGKVILQENHYYPYGKEIVSLGRKGSPNHEFTYNGKELSEEFNWNTYDYGARGLDADFPVWKQVDPLAEKMRRWSPYAYAFNNPVRFIDPDGMAPMDDPIHNLKGEKIGDDGKSEGKIHIVYNNKQAKDIKETGGITNLDNIDKITIHGGVKTVEGVIASVEDEKKETSTGAGDGGLHEEGGHTQKDKNGNVMIVKWKPGSKKTLTGGGAISMFNGIDDKNIPSSEEFLDAWHIHTSKTQEISNGDGATTTTYRGSMNPSGNPGGSDYKGDYGQARRLAETGYNSNIQVGTSMGTVVNFFNGSGTIASMKYKNFKKLLK